MCDGLTRVLRGAALALLFIFHGTAADAASPRVVTTIKPIHSIVAGVMAGVGSPALLLPDGASPHAYAMRPSDARLVRYADLIIWVGGALESFLDKPLHALARKAVVVELLNAPGIVRRATRRGGAWTRPQTDGEDRHGGGARGRGHAHGEYDPHIWLDPRNAAVIAHRAAAELTTLDPANAGRYAANAGRVAQEIMALERELNAVLAPVKDTPYVVYHDAYQYFERRFGMNVVGSVTLSPERKPGAKRLRDVRRKIRHHGVRCVFGEPQFDSSLVKTVIRTTGARADTLNPLGLGIAAGSGAYAATLHDLATTLRRCLAPGP